MGEVVIGAEVIGRLVSSTSDGWTGEGTYSVEDQGKPVVGHDKQLCTLVVRLRLLPFEGPAGGETAEAEETVHP